MIASLRPILLVEDNPMDVDLTLQAFEQHQVGNPVVVCRDGEEALAYVKAHRTTLDNALPLVVLLDLRLPKVDGLDVLRHVREDDIWRRIPFVVLTTSRENPDIETAYALGANSYIVKPVDFEAFMDVVRTIKAYWLLTNEPPFSEPPGR